MYSYDKELPRGFGVVNEITEGSSAKIFILMNDEGKKIVRKISDIEGINKNGKEKLKKEINFLEFFHNNKSSKMYPSIYNYEVNDSYVYYDMEFVKGYTLTELFSKRRKKEIEDCYNTILNDLCFFF